MSIEFTQSPDSLGIALKRYDVIMLFLRTPLHFNARITLKTDDSEKQSEGRFEIGSENADD